ncbi:MAG: hypothetical protein R3E96_07940 [Planctomycetota bacterium]
MKSGEERSWRRKLAGAGGAAGEADLEGGRGLLVERAAARAVPDRRAHLEAQGPALALHGGGTGQADAVKALALYEPVAQRFGFLLLAPEVLEPVGRAWTRGGTEPWLMQLIEDLCAQYPIDADRVYLAGHSMGGIGTWEVGAHHAGPVCGLVPGSRFS